MMKWLQNENLLRGAYFHSTKFWQHMQIKKEKSSRRSTKFDAVIAWKYARKFCNGHTKQCFNEIRLHFFPLNIYTDHWVLFIVSFDDKLVYSIDSLGGTHEQHYDIMKVFLMLVLSNRDDGGIDKERNAWNHKPLSVPGNCRQRDSFNCGIFVILYTIIIANDPSLLQDIASMSSTWISHTNLNLWRGFIFEVIVSLSQGV